MSGYKVNKLTAKKIQEIANHDLIKKVIKKSFKRIFDVSAVQLASLILAGDYIDIDVKLFKQDYGSFISRNTKLFNKTIVDKKETFLLKNEVAKTLYEDLLNCIKKIGTSIKDVEDDEEKWSVKQINGEEFYEVNEATTFQDIREILGKEGKDINFRYSFKQPDMILTPYNNKKTLQMVDAHINNDGEYFGYPVKFVYICPECNEIHTTSEYVMSSKQSNKLLCPTNIESFDKHDNIKLKKCGEILVPDINRTETKDSYIYDISLLDEDGVYQKADAFSFVKLPKGNLRVVLQKIPRAFGRQFVHIVDFQELKTESFKLPEKTKQHYIFDLIKGIDKYIFKITNYKHYGYLPMKIAMLLQLFSRYNKHIKNNYHISFSGTMSSGKSQFARYWGLTLYSQSCWSSNATSISIPKLRGTMESFHLFGKDHRYQYKGLFGEKDLIIIDEVKENKDIKSNLKQYALEPTYEYSKQGSNNQTYERTAQLITTQNIDTAHLDKYVKEIHKIYIGDNLVITDENVGPKPAWDYEVDLTLALHTYKNPYLKYAIKKIRDSNERSQINWIDGSELALKQRFFFYFYLSSEKTNPELQRVIKENNVKKIVSSNIEIMKLVNCDKLKEFAENTKELFDSDTDLEFFDKVDTVLDNYHKKNDARTRGMSYTLLKILRMIDGRKDCNEDDLNIFKYIIENIDNKIEIADTDEFKISGPKEVEYTVDERADNKDEWGYESDSKIFGD